MTRYARPVLALVFIALLATPYLMRRYGPRAAVAAGTVSDPRSQYGFRLKESAKAAGIDFVHEAPTLDARLAHIMPQVASMGAAVSVVDVDADGLPDLHVTNSKEGSHNRLYRNRGDGTFEDIARQLGLADVNRPENGVSMGAVWGDYDNDGYDDVLLHRWGRTELLRNEGGRAFAPVTTADLPHWANINSAVWFDFDRDGRLDLFLGGYYPENVNLWKLADTKMMPASFEYAANGGRKYLYRNLGEGRFEEVSERVGLSSRRWALAAVAADQRRRTVPRGGPRGGRGVCAEERHERVGRGRAELRTVRHLRVEHLGRGHPPAGEQPLGAGIRSGRHARLREHGTIDGRGPRRLELRRAVRGSQQ
jgi:hypothetical protein